MSKTKKRSLLFITGITLTRGVARIFKGEGEGGGGGGYTVSNTLITRPRYHHGVSPPVTSCWLKLKSLQKGGGEGRSRAP